ncbi:MAG TPA: rhodanese-like domain-containing protein, partial [Terriglobales bacterium]|nr:rhodanese-like domain-containing protein [Terriglobales bacterium]
RRADEDLRCARRHSRVHGEARAEVDGEVAAIGKRMDYEINPEEVKNKLDAKESFTLLDVREPWEFETAKIEGAKLMPMGDVPSRAHQELDPEDHMVVICHHGVRSMNVTAWLRQQGFEKAQSMRGGIDAWSRRVDGTVPVY